MSAAAPAPPAETRPKPAGRISQLMIKCGSEGYWTPNSDENERWVMKHGSPNDRVIAAIRHRSMKRESQWILNDDGSIGNANTLAADTGYSVKTIHNILSEERKTGRVDGSVPGRICYGGNPQNGPGIDGRTEGEEHSPVQGNLPAYVADSIRALPEADRKAKEDAYRRERAAFFADGQAQLRAAFHAQIEPIIFDRLGLAKDRLPVREAPPARWVQLSLLNLDSLGGGTEGEGDSPVQGNVQGDPEAVVQNGEPPEYRGKNGAVQPVSDPVLYLEREREREESVSQVIPTPQQASDDRPTKPIEAPPDSPEGGPRPERPEFVRNLDQFVTTCEARLRETRSSVLMPRLYALLSPLPNGWVVEYTQEVTKRLASSGRWKLGLLLRMAEDKRKAWDLVAASHRHAEARQRELEKRRVAAREREEAEGREAERRLDELRESDRQRYNELHERAEAELIREAPAIVREIPKMAKKYASEHEDSIRARMLKALRAGGTQ